MLDLELLFHTPFYMTKGAIRERLRRWDHKLRGTLLDVGCGSRSYAKLLRSHNTYHGLELNHAQKPDICGSALALPIANGSVDSILCLEVLEHLPEPELALRNMFRVLKPGGHVVLSTPMSWYLHYEPYDFYRYTKYGLKYLFEKTGFIVHAIEATGGIWTTFLSRAVESLFHVLFFLTYPMRWIFRSDKGRWRVAVALTIPFTLAALLIRAIFESKNSPFVQGWVILAEKPSQP